MKTKLFVVLLIVGLGLAGFVCVRYYEFVFAKTIQGEVLDVQRVNENTAVISGAGGNIPTSAMFSFAIAIRSATGEIFTASSEDRQWAVVSKGQCAQARFFPYAPWELAKAGTFHDARLVKLFDCAQLGITPTTPSH